MSHTLVVSILSLFSICVTNGFLIVQPQHRRYLSTPFSQLSPPIHTHSSKFQVFVALSSITSNLNSPSHQEQQNQHQTKLQILKDRMWVRETLEDLTAAEFACSIAMASTITTTGQSSSRIKKSQSVDYDNILGNLNRRIEEMCVATTVGEAEQLGVTFHTLNVVKTQVSSIDDVCWILREHVGKGSVTYTSEQRDALLV